MSKQEVTIIGGGLAGVTLAIQLARENSNIKITVIDKRKTEDVVNDHKVGESTVELATYYMREVLGLKDYLDTHQLPKRGLRYFISPEHKNQIEARFEMGPKNVLPVPSHQLDRGVLERDLIEIVQKEYGVNFISDATVVNVNLENGNHQVDYEKNGETHTLLSNWLVDSSGRNFFIKKKLNLEKEMEHNINTVWWRYHGVVDVEDWSDNPEWHSKLNKGVRKLATVHLMDKGYWVWIIPLVGGNTSIGIVADPKIHPLHTYNSYEKALEWLSVNEPQAHREFTKSGFKATGFKALKRFSYDNKQFYSKDRWAVTGESGAFLDPFYSPGSDFISLNNTWVSNLIQRDLAGEDIRKAAMLFEITHKALLENWIPIYLDKYNLFGSEQIMAFKVFWDWTVYWGIPSIAFINKGYTDLETLRTLFAKADSPIPKFAVLSKNVQNFFLDWLPYNEIKASHTYVDLIEMDFIKKLHFDLDRKMTQDELCEQIDENLILMEQVATYMFQIVSKEIFDLDTDLNVDPYTFNLKKGKETLLEESEQRAKIAIPEGIKADIHKVWFGEVKELA